MYDLDAGWGCGPGSFGRSQRGCCALLLLWCYVAAIPMIWYVLLLYLFRQKLCCMLYIRADNCCCGGRRVSLSLACRGSLSAAAYHKSDGMRAVGLSSTLAVRCGQRITRPHDTHSRPMPKENAPYVPGRMFGCCTGKEHRLRLPSDEHHGQYSAVAMNRGCDAFSF